MRRVGGGELNERPDFVDVRRAFPFTQHVHVLHHRRDGGVIGEARGVVPDFTDCLVQLPEDVRVRRSIAPGIDDGEPEAELGETNRRLYSARNGQL